MSIMLDNNKAQWWTCWWWLWRLKTKWNTLCLGVLQSMKAPVLRTQHSLLWETKEFLLLQFMHTTTGANIICEVLNAFDKFGLNLSTVCGIATDGAQAMSRTGIGSVVFLKPALKEKNICWHSNFPLYYSSIKAFLEILTYLEPDHNSRKLYLSSRTKPPAVSEVFQWSWHWTSKFNVHFQGALAKQE